MIGISKMLSYGARALFVWTLVVMLFAARSEAHAQSSGGLVTRTAYGTINCSADRVTVISGAVLEALRMLQKEYTDAHFQYWFGNDPALNDQIRYLAAYANQYALLSLLNFSDAARGGLVWQNPPLVRNVTFDCASASNARPAQVTGAGATVIRLNEGFWTVPNRLNNLKITKASVIIHELTHLAGTVDFDPQQFGFGNEQPQSFLAIARSLAVFNPYFAVWNANNHEFYYLGLQ